METATSRTPTDRLAAAGPSPMRVERTIALIRIAVFAAVLVGLSSSEVDATRAPVTAVLLGLTGAYAFACLVLALADDGVATWVRAASLLIDAGMITLWIQATGGALSELWSLYLVVVVAAALRFGMVETIAVSIVLATVHTWMLVASGGLTATRLHRPTLLIVGGFAVGALARQRAEQRRRRREAEAVAEARAAALGLERAEVERLRRVDDARAEFVGVAAHEVRTPLAGILGVLGTLRDHGSELDASVREEMIRGAEAQAERLSRLVEDLLAVSRIDDGALRLSLAAADPAALVDEAVEASGTAGRVCVERRLPSEVVCDADATIRVLTNLLDNARKYAPSGSEIVVAVGPDPSGVRFSVRDAGPGIAPDDRQAVFERFGRARTGEQPGVGLGLYIARRLVRAQGAELELGTAPEGGAEFSFALPSGATRERVDGQIPPDVNHITVSGIASR